jgi:hypothetical protein
VRTLLHRIFGVLLVGALLAPAAAGLCVGTERCVTEPSEHSCCDTTRLTNCDDCLDGTYPANGTSEGAQQAGMTAPVLLVDQLTVPTTVTRGIGPTREHAVRPQATSDRLSLLSLLIV